MRTIQLAWAYGWDGLYAEGHFGHVAWGSGGLSSDFF